MMFPGTPARKYNHEGDDQAFKAFLLRVLDDSPDHLGVIEIPRTNSMAKLDEMEANLIRAYDLAKEERPNLSVKVIPSIPIPGQGRPPRSDIMVVVHEHQFVGGVCVNGCTDRREVN